MASVTDINAGTSMFWNTNPIIEHGTSMGHGSNDYTQDMLMQFHRAIYGQGVIFRDGTELRIATGFAGQVDIEPGWAIVHGFWYWLPASISQLPLSIPMAGSTGGYIGLRVDWANATVFPSVYHNDESDPLLPDLLQHQVTGTEYFLPLYSFVVDSSGNVALVDMREAAGVPTATPFDLSAYSLSALGDVNIPNDPANIGNGDQLIWDTATDKWILSVMPPAGAPTAVISGALPGTGSRIITPSSDDSVLGSAATSFTNFAWVVKDGVDATIVSFNGAGASSPAASSNAAATLTGTYANPIIDLTASEYDTYTCQLTVTDDTPLVSAAVTFEYILLASSWWDLRTVDWTTLGLNMPNTAGITVTSSSFASTGTSALTGTRDAILGMRLKASSGGAERIVMFENLSASLNDTKGHSWDIVFYLSTTGLNRVWLGAQNSAYDPSAQYNQARDMLCGLYEYGSAIDTAWGSDKVASGVDWQQAGPRLQLTSGSYNRIRLESVAGGNPGGVGTAIFYGTCSSTSPHDWLGTPTSFISNKPSVTATQACLSFLFYRDKPFGSYQNYSLIAAAIDADYGATS